MTVFLLHLPEPVGWIALTPEFLREVQAVARETLRADTNNSDTTIPRASAVTLLTAEDAGRLLSVDASWLLRQAREGRIPHVKLGRYVRFDPRELVGRCTKNPASGS